MSETVNSFDNIIEQSALATTIANAFDLYQNEYFTPRKSEFFCLELNGEAGELANLEKKSWKGKDIPKERFEDEAADVFIALMNYCNSRGIDIGTAVQNKLRIIEQKRAELAQKGELY